MFHRIDSGSFTTTIGVELSAPGIHFPSTGSFGGWTGGWKPGGEAVNAVYECKPAFFCPKTIF
jgi:hypothetical protein